MRENEKEQEELKDSHPKNLLMEKILIIVFAWALNTAQSQAKYRNNQNDKLLQGQNGKRSRKEEQKSKSQKAGTFEQWRRGGNFAGCKNSQPAKLPPLPNFL